MTTDERIEALMREASAAGDMRRVVICRAALGLPVWAVEPVEGLGSPESLGDCCDKEYASEDLAQAAMDALPWDDDWGTRPELEVVVHRDSARWPMDEARAALAKAGGAR